jgi:Carboxypeptidase regulatory-like domain
VGAINGDGTVPGQVTDPGGAVVNGANVSLRDQSTGATHTATTNEAGRYTFVNVTPGSYDISITKQGFAATKIAGQTVEVGKLTTVNVGLQVGTASEVVEVQATGTELQTTNATVVTRSREWCGPGAGAAAGHWPDPAGAGGRSTNQHWHLCAWPYH